MRTGFWVAAELDFEFGQGATRPFLATCQLAHERRCGLPPGAAANNVLEETEFSTRRLSGSAFGWSSFLSFVSRRSLQLRSAPSVNLACAALAGAYPKIAPCSLPRPPAPLRSGD